MKNKKGFTLIELLIVIGIIAILAAAVIVAINPGQQFQQARNATRWSHMNSVMNAVYSAAITEGGTYPTCIQSYDSTDASLVDLAECQDDLVDTGNFMSALPQDPSLSEGDDYTVDLSNHWTDLTSGTHDYACDPETDTCTGYIIGFTDDSENRVRIVSFMSESGGEAEDVVVVQ